MYQAPYMGKPLLVLADKPCLGLASSYRAAGRYATALALLNTTTSTTQPHHSQFSPNPHSIPTHTRQDSSILTDFYDS